MSKEVENVLNNKEAKATDYFELVNTYEYSDLSVHKDGNTIISMSINKFEEFCGAYEFSQKCSMSHFTIEESNVESVTGKMLDNMDTCLIEINMKDESRISICIYHVDTNEKLESEESYCETDVYSLYDYLNQPNHTPMMAIIRDSFGMEIKLNKMRYIALDKETEGSFTLWVTDEEDLSISFPLIDDSCNEIYIKESEVADTILIRPYSQPFMEVSILVAKESSKKRNTK
ncbi:MAG: hypothetical protein ACLVCT_02925 [Lachnospira sp.]